MNNTPGGKRPLGITVLADFLLSEGIDCVLDNLRRAGATAVACNPTVTAPASESNGTFQPPSDAGTSPRRFDRPLFGKHALWVRSGPSFRPNAAFYGDSAYGPRKPNDLTDAHGELIGRFVDTAIEDGLKVYLQIGAVQPTGLRDEDRPRLPDGRLPNNRMADTGSLASPAIRAYNRAYARDLLSAYPRITGLRIDWPEYPCYTFDEVFQDFSPHVARWVERHGVDLVEGLSSPGGTTASEIYEQVQTGVKAFYNCLQGRLTNDDLQPLAFPKAALPTWHDVANLADSGAAIEQWLRIKSALSTDLLREWREAVADSGAERKELAAGVFMPTYSGITGMNFAQAAQFCDALSPKLYTMHWSLMVKFWGDRLLAANPGLDEQLVVGALVNLMDLVGEGENGRRIADYGYPRPEEPHPIPNEPQQRKIAQAKRAIGGKAALYPLAHGYGPLDDFCRRFQLIADSDVDGVWINRYGYLSDEKIDAIARIWR